METSSTPVCDAMVDQRAHVAWQLRVRWDLRRNRGDARLLAGHRGHLRRERRHLVAQAGVGLLLRGGLRAEARRLVLLGRDRRGTSRPPRWPGRQRRCRLPTVGFETCQHFPGWAPHSAAGVRVTDEPKVTQVLATVPGTVPVPGTSASVDVVKYGSAKPPSFAALSSHVATSLWAKRLPGEGDRADTRRRARRRCQGANRHRRRDVDGGEPHVLRCEQAQVGEVGRERDLRGRRLGEHRRSLICLSLLLR